MVSDRTGHLARQRAPPASASTAALATRSNDDVPGGNRGRVRHFAHAWRQREVTNGHRNP